MRSWMNFSYVDYETQKRYPKVSAYWYKQVSEIKEV